MRPGRRTTASIDERSGHTGCGLFEPLQMVASPNRAVVQALPRRIEQRHLQLAPMHGVLRIIVACLQPPRFGPNRLALSRVKAQRARYNRGAL